MRKLMVVVLSMVMWLSVAQLVMAAPQDTWKIVSPADGATVTGPDVTITVTPGDVKVVKPGPVVAGEGHWHFLVDGKDAGKGPTNTFTYKDLTPGKHLLRVTLQQGDHSPFPGDTGREITVNVALPNTGANVIWLSVAGVLLLAGGGYLMLRKQSALAR
jgi:LPXTG-motif cell wall-anchored protein